jgi:Zn-dependent protease
MNTDPWWARETFRLGYIAGIRVGVNWSAPGLVVLFAYLFAGLYLPRIYPGQPAVVCAVAGTAVAAVFVVSLLGHEMAHAVIARRNNLAVERIVLWAGGGATKTTSPAPSPGIQLRMAVAGPLASLAAGVAFAAIALGIGSAAGTAGVLLLAVVWLGHINILVAAANAIPALPLDGGQMLYALAWWRTGQEKATTVAAWTSWTVKWTGLAGGAALFLATRSLYGIDGVVLGLCASGSTGEKKQAGDAPVNCL